MSTSLGEAEPGRPALIGYCTWGVWVPVGGNQPEGAGELLFAHAPWCPKLRARSSEIVREPSGLRRLLTRARSCDMGSEVKGGGALLAADEEAGAGDVVVGGAGGGQDRPGGTGGPHDRGAENPGGPEAPGDPDVPGGPAAPRDSDDPGGPAAPRDPDVPRGPEAPGDRHEPGGPRAPRAPGCAILVRHIGGIAVRVEHVPRAPGAAGLGGGACPGAGALGDQLLQFSLSVPFPSPMEVEIARWFLSQHEAGGSVQKEVSADGSTLALRLTSEDPGQLRTAITSCLDQLSLVVRTLQHFVPPFFIKPRLGRGG